MASEWEETAVGELVRRGILERPMDGNHGSIHPKGHDFVPSGVPFIMASDLIGGGIDTVNCSFITLEQAKSLRKGFAKRGDVLLSHKATLGRTAIIGDIPGEFVMLTPQVTYYRAKDPSKLNNRYLKFYFDSVQFQEVLQSWAGAGSTRAYIGITDQLRLPILLPPLPEQKAIAHILGTLDDKIELNRRMNATLEAMARALFQSWFVDFDPVRAKLDGRHPAGLDEATAALFPAHFQDSPLGPIPQGWEATTLGKEIEFFTGFAFKSDLFFEERQEVRLARGDNVKEGFFHWDSKTRYWPEVTPDLERYQLKTGDVLIGMDGSKVGKNWVRVRRCDLPCLLVQRVACLRQSLSIGEHFIWLLISDPRFRFHVEAIKTGTSIPHISGGQIKAYDFIRPPKGDNRLFHKFEQLVAPLGERMDANIEQARTLATIRDTLLPKLLSGELSVSSNEVARRLKDA